jgi:hypothetical protein
MRQIYGVEQRIRLPMSVGVTAPASGEPKDEIALSHRIDRFRNDAATACLQ